MNEINKLKPQPQSSGQGQAQYSQNFFLKINRANGQIRNSSTVI